MEYKNINEIVKEKYWIMPATPKFIEKKEIPYITSKNIKNGKINFENVKYISKEDYAKLIKNRKIKKDDMLISMIGTLGEIAIVNEEDFPFYGQNVYLIRLNQSIVDNKYFYYFFNSDRIKHYLQSKKNSSTQGYIKTAHIESIKIPLYNMDKQKEIVSNLNKVKMIISKQKEQLELLENLKKSQFFEMFGNPIKNDKDWEKVKLSDVAKIIMGQSPPSSSYNEKGIGMPFYQGNVDFGEKYPKIKKYTDKITKIANENTILMSVRAPVGELNITKIECCIGRGLCSIKINGELNLEYLFYYLKNIMINIKKVEKGSTFKSINRKEIENIEVLLPPLELQNKFATKIEAIQKLKFRKLKSLEKTENSKIIQKFLALK